jgi:hypothetical protein
VRGRVLLLLLLLVAGLAPAGSAHAFATNPPLIPAFKPSIHDYVARCVAGHPLRVRIDKKTQAYRLGDGQKVAVKEGGRYFRVRCLPKKFPNWIAERNGNPQAKYFLVTPALGEHGTHFVALFDRNGVPIWWKNQPDKPYDAKLTPDGQFVWTTFTNTQFGIYSVPYVKYSLSGKRLRKIAAPGIPTDFHDMQIMPNGDYLLDSYVPRSGVDLSAYGGPKKATVMDNEIEEVDRAGRLVWLWKSKDHIALSESEPFMKYILNGPVTLPDGRKVYDIVHLNSVEPDGDSLIISTRHTGMYKISRATGAVEWKIGGTQTPQSLTVIGDPSGQKISGQHDARVLPDGTVTVHDNHTLIGHSRPRAMRFQIDESARTATVLEALTDPGSVYSTCCGSARKLPGGDWVVAWGGSGLITESKPDGERVYSLQFGGTHASHSYRAEPVMPGRLSARALIAGMDAMAGKP